MEEMRFDDIRPYHDLEVDGVIQQLIKEPQFQQVFAQYVPEMSYDDFQNMLLSCHTIKQFQATIIVPLLERMVAKTTNGFGISGLENLEKGKSCLFVSTHRDIVLDSALLNLTLLKHGHESAEIAIGDNLMTIPWVVDFVKLNKTFIVKRTLPVEQRYQASADLSAYINYTIKEKKESIWIAQKSGRSKDGNDRTNPSLIKMFNMSAPHSEVLKNIAELNIVPMAISYEYNPCDSLTMPELMTTAKGEKYVKAPMEDMIHMAQGIQGHKGKAHLSFGKPLDLSGLEGIRNKNELFGGIANLIDQQIHQIYGLSDTNYIAHDVLHNENQFADKYSKEEKTAFEAYVSSKCQKIEGDPAFIKEVFLNMYAYPVKNKLAASSS